MEQDTSMLPPPDDDVTRPDHKVPSAPPEFDPRNTEAPLPLIEALEELRQARDEMRADREQMRTDREETRRMQREVRDAADLFFSETGAFGAMARMQQNIDKNVRLTLAQMNTIRARQNAFEARLAEGDLRFDQHDELFDQHDQRIAKLEVDKAACEKRYEEIQQEIDALKAARGQPSPRQEGGGDASA